MTLTRFYFPTPNGDRGRELMVVVMSGDFEFWMFPSF